jgi:hypothetical protein
MHAHTQCNALLPMHAACQDAGGSAGNAWQADHIKAVHLGGGLCSIANLRTLCTACHLDVTARQARERAQAAAAGNSRSLAEMFDAARNSASQGCGVGGRQTVPTAARAGGAKRAASASVRPRAAKAARKCRSLAEFLRSVGGAGAQHADSKAAQPDNTNAESVTHTITDSE